MKPPDPGAGKAAARGAAGRFRRGRRNALRAVCAGVAALAGCGIEPRADSRAEPEPGAGLGIEAARFLVPMGSVRGGFALAPAPARGARVPPPGPYFALLGPVAAAARGSDVFLVDAGHGAVFHYDQLRQTLRRFPGFGGRPGMKLCVLGDMSVMVFDPLHRRLARVSREGTLLARLEGDALLAGALDLAVDDATGTVWLSDATVARLIAVRPALNAIVPLPFLAQPGDAVAQVAAIAAGPDALYVLDAARSRVVRLDAQGRVLQVFGEGLLRQPRALAVDRHRRVYVADAHDRNLHVFLGGRHAAAIAAGELGAAEIRDLRVHDSDLAISDALGASVHLFRVLAVERPG